ncbi:MAG: dihydrofolate reductase [Rikenellaceae bacterium]
MTNISIIVAIASNGAIGKDNDLLWHLKADLKHFKAITTGHTIIMGRKTFESIGRPLPGRRNVVISSQKEFCMDGIEVFHSLEEVLEAVKNDGEVFVIGGGEIYRQTMPLATKLYLTVVDREYEADTFFVGIDYSQWQEKSSQSQYEGDLKFSFKEYIKI